MKIDLFLRKKNLCKTCKKRAKKAVSRCYNIYMCRVTVNRPFEFFDPPPTFLLYLCCISKLPPKHEKIRIFSRQILDKFKFIEREKMTHACYLFFRSLFDMKIALPQKQAPYSKTLVKKKKVRTLSPQKKK